jgi:succinate dehydrogenase / fumarate reductase cytochrome b subunit
MAQATPTRALARGPVTGTATHLDAKRKRSPFFVELYRSALGKKYVMAVTGVALMGYVLAHMIGNLKMYLGKDASGVYDIDHYGEFLRELLVPLAPRTVVLWILRGGLIAAFVFHIHAAYSLTVMNRRARVTRYQSPRDYIAANFASRTMRWTGIILALFILWHLADFTWGWVNPGFVRGEVYRNVDASLSRWPVAILYILGNLALGVHLFHGAWSLFQSLGLNNPRFNIWRRWFAIGFSALIVVGNVSFPVAVLAGIVKV